MIECPKCHETLSDESLRGKRCSACGASLFEDQTGDQTVDSGGSSDFSDLAEKLAQPSSDSQTIDASALPDGFDPAGQLDSTDGDYSVDEADRITDQPYSQTIDASSMSEALDDLLDGLPDEPAGGRKTIDDADGSGDVNRTISGPAINQTVDASLDQFAEDQFAEDLGAAGLAADGSGVGDGGSGDRLNQTVESVDPVDLPVQDRAPGSGTVDARPINQTLDSGSFDGDFAESPLQKPGTLPDRGPQATIDSNAPAAEQHSGGGTVHAREVQQTYDSSAAGGADSNRMHQMWGGAANEKASPQMTIRGNDSQDAPPQSSLVIQQRAILSQDAGAPSARADYDILSKLGQGGMGVVYAARQASIDRTVAVKMLKPEGAADPNQRNKFLSEAVITGELEHPNIVPIYDLGHNDENALFYAMKRVQGTPWDEKIKQNSLAENLEIFMKTCDAVAFGHSRGIIHRDLKPENTMIGDFGEVLVMDWGLALPFGRHANARTVKIQASMGGTPAYMAPEMATGPFDKMGPPSDIYLLGAILFEIVTGKPPHHGKDVMKCLFAAAKNEIVPTEITGELIDIAHRAMATKIEDRYASVQELQAAIRQYQEHSESIAMATRAGEELVAATESDDYERFSRAVFGYHEAYTLWAGNHKAKQGISQAKLAYAGSAKRKGDLDLALSLIDPQDDAHQAMQREILDAQREREARTHRLRRAKQAVVGLVAIVLIGGSVGLVAINHQRGVAVAERDAANIARADAKKQQAIAEDERDKAAEQERIAEDERDNAKEQERIAKEQERFAKEQKEIASNERDKAKEQEQIAKEQKEIAATQRDNAKEQERIAKEQEQIAKAEKEKAEYETYLALIGLASAKIEENAFDTARELLARCKSDLRNWEWRRLQHLCTQSSSEFDARARINATAFAPDGERFVTGSWDGYAHIWRKDREQPIVSIKHDGLYVYAVAWSPTADLIATGSNSPSGFLRLSDATTGKTVRLLKGHAEPVLSAHFSPDGKYLVSTSLDKTARLWDVSTGKQARPPFVGHNWWVWDAAFSPDGRHIVTASHDGTAMVWPVNDQTASPTTIVPASLPSPSVTTASLSGASPPGPAATAAETAPGRAMFSGHTGPVYAVAYSPDGTYVASGGYDKQVLLWRPGKVQPFDFEGMLAGRPVAPNFKLLGAHAAAVRSVEFSHDGKLVISAGHDNTIKLWHVETGQLLESLRGHGGWVRDCAISPDDKWVLSGGYDTHAKLWSIDGYEEVRVMRGRVLHGHADAVMSAAFSGLGDKIVTASRDRSAMAFRTTDGSQLATYVEGHAFLASTAQFFAKGTRLMTSAIDNTVRVWDVETGVELRRMDGAGIAAAAAVASDGRWILTGGGQPDPQVELWDAKLWEAETGKLVGTFQGHKAEVTAVAFSPDDRFLFTGDANGRGVLWDRATEKQLARLSWHTSKITAAAFLPDGSRLLTASDDKTVCPWDVSRLSENAATVKPLEQLVLKHPDTVWSLDVSQDGGKALTSCEDGRLRWWDLATPKVLREISFEAASLGFARLAPDGGSAISVHPEARTVRRWNLLDGREILSPDSRGKLGPLLDLNVEGGLVWTAEYTPDGNAVLTVGGNEARLWSLGNDENKERERMSFSPHGAVASANFSPDGKRVVTASWDMTARIWDAATGRDLRKLIGHQGYVNSAVYSPDGTQVLTASNDKTAVLWDAQAGQVLMTLTGHPDRVRCAAFSTDGSMIVTGCEDSLVRIWSARDGELLRELRGHEFGVGSAAFSRDDKYVITGSDDQSARIWEVATGQSAQLLASHTAAVTSVAFSPDGLRALSASEDFTAKLWDTTNGREILNLKGHTQEVTSVSFSEDGRYALTSSRDGTAIVWLTYEPDKEAQAE